MWKACSLLGSQPPGSPPPCSACAAPAPPLAPPPASQQLTEPEPGPPAKAAAEEHVTDGAEARCACEAGSRQETARQAASETGGGASETGGIGDGGPSQAQSQADPPCARHWSLACTAGSVQLRVTSCSKAGRLPGPGMQGSGTDVLGRGAGHWPRLCVRSCFSGGRGPAGPGSGGAAHVHGVLPPAPRHEIHLALLLRRVCTVTGVCLELSSDFVAR